VEKLTGGTIVVGGRGPGEGKQGGHGGGKQGLAWWGTGGEGGGEGRTEGLGE